MSPDQLLMLQKLSRLFELGQAGPAQIRQLSELLATINHHKELFEENETMFLKSITEHV